MKPLTFLRWAATIFALCGTAAKADTTLLDFGASWCGPCQRMTPLVEQLEQEGYSVRKVDVDREPALARQYGVTSVPCFVFIENSRETGRIDGATDIETLRRKLKPQVATAPKAAAPKAVSPVVRIKNDHGQMQEWGSGTVCDVGDGRFAVLSCAHIFTDGVGKITVYTADGKGYPAKLLGQWKAQDADLSALSIALPPVTLVPLAADRADVGEPTRLIGYGGQGVYRAVDGQVLDAPIVGTDLCVSGGARQGDSGGPIINARGELTAVLWGTDGKETYGTCCHRIRQFLQNIRPKCPCQPQRPRVVPRKPAPKPQGPTVEIPAPNDEQVVERPDCPGCQCDNDKLLAEIAALKLQLVELSKRECPVPEPAKPFTFVLKQDGKLKAKKLVKPGETVGINVITKKTK